MRRFTASFLFKSLTMKNLVTILLIIYSSINLHGQYKIYYTVKKKISNKNLEADGVLQFNVNEKKSIFYLSQYKNLIKKNYEIKENGDTIKVLHNNSICQDKKGYFYDYKNNNRTLLLYDVVCDSKTLISDKIKYPVWKVEKNSFKYKKWNVYKATATINDRNWNVLFTKDEPEIQNAGPWLFVGLPGLIVSASDDQDIYTFDITKIEKNNRTKIAEPKFFRTANFKQYSDKAISSNKRRMAKKISQEYNIPEKEVNLSGSPKYETLDFIEK